MNSKAYRDGRFTLRHFDGKQVKMISEWNGTYLSNYSVRQAAPYP
jgi:hypothetical protein